MSKPADLPNDVETLKALLVASEGRNLRKQDRIDQLEKLVSDFKRALFGAKSEKADPEQGSMDRITHTQKIGHSRSLWLCGMIN
jgi:hypothetical protein